MSRLLCGPDAAAVDRAAFDDDRPVTTSLYFTEIDTDSGAEFSAGGGTGSLEELRSSLDRRLCQEIEAQTDATFAAETGSEASNR